MFQKGKKSEKKNPNLHKLNPPFSLSKSFLSCLGDSASGSLAFLNIKLNNKYYKLVLPFFFYPLSQILEFPQQNNFLRFSRNPFSQVFRQFSCQIPLRFSPYFINKGLHPFYNKIHLFKISQA